MSTRRHILVVGQGSKMANTVIPWLSSAGYELSVVYTFAAAKVYLNAGPDLVLTDLKLAQYNGLHLALRAQALGIPSIVLGPEDAVLEKDATELGVAYVTSIESRSQLIQMVSDVIVAGHPPAEPLSGNAPSNRAELTWNRLNGPSHATVDQLGRRLLLH